MTETIINLIGVGIIGVCVGIAIGQQLQIRWCERHNGVLKDTRRETRK